jgi:hypothetical protein
MYSDEDLDSAVASGALSAEAAAAFRAHIAGLRRTPAVDEEHFRLVTGFNDIFVVIACALLLTSVGSIGSTKGAWIGALATAAVAWLLAEFFVRKRRMALPAIVLLITFVGAVFATGFLLLNTAESSISIASFVAAAAAWVHWQRFHVPITVAAGVGTIVAGFIAVLVVMIPSAKDLVFPLMFVSGLAVFALALRWDMSDIKRETRRSDIAFWLHLLAAPLLVHPVFKALGVFSDQVTLVQTLLATALYVAIAMVSLAVDRRALMVSALGYILYAFTTLLRNSGVVSLDFALTALVIGSALLLLSAFWHGSRRNVLGRLPSSVTARLPPVRS